MFIIRDASENDVPAILQLIRELAEYERLLADFQATEDGLRDKLFGSRQFAEVLLAESEGEIVGYALFFHTFSTFRGEPGIYLEDLFVRPKFRMQGMGKALLSRIAQIAAERGCGRLEWAVLNWNEPAFRFYERLGAVQMDGWTVMRIAGSELARLAGLRVEDS